MTVVRTDLIPNLYANPISYVVQYNPAYVVVPVVATIVSTTGTIGTVTGSGTQEAPWTATITLMSAVTGLIVGNVITSTDGSGTFAAGGEVSVASIVGNQSIQIIKVGGTIPTAGTVTDITLPGQTTLPTFLASGDPILFTNPGNQFTFTVFSSNGTFVAGETFIQDTTGATGIITNVIPADDVNDGLVDYTATSGVVDTTYNVVGNTSGAYAIPATVTGMNELLTAGENGTNQFYVELAGGDRTEFNLYTDPELTIPVDSTLFTEYTRNAGQYTVTDTVLITVPTV